MSADSLPRGIHWLALSILVLVWGSSFILIKRGLVSFSSMEVGALRIVITFLALSPFVFKQLKKVPRSKLIVFLLVGVIGNGMPPFLYAKAQTVIDSYMAGVLNSLTPLFTLLAGVLFFKIRTRWFNVLGVAIGLGGAIGLLSVANSAQVNNMWYSLYAVAAALCYAINMNLIKQYLADFNALTITSVVFFFIGVPSLIYLFLGTSFLNTMATDSKAMESLGYIAILALLGTALAMIIHNWLIKQTSALFTSTVTYLMPIVSIVWGVVDGENFLFIYMLWITIILLGVYVATRKKKNNTT